MFEVKWCFLYDYILYFGHVHLSVMSILKTASCRNADGRLNRAVLSTRLCCYGNEPRACRKSNLEGGSQLCLCSGSGVTEYHVPLFLWDANCELRSENFGILPKAGCSVDQRKKLFKQQTNHIPSK